MPGHKGYRVPILDRFWAKVEKSNGCWKWTGMRAHGYGYLWREGKMVRAHRLSYELFVGDPGDRVVMHRCDNPGCVNPDHLTLGTVADNNADMRAKQRHALPPPGGGRAGATHCVRGHLLSRVNGRTRCPTCENEAKRAKRRATAGMCGLA